MTLTQTSSLLNRAIDSLYLRLGSALLPSPWLLAHISEWRLYKNSYDYKDPVDFYVELPHLGTFRLLPFGHRPYEFTLTNPKIGDIHIWNPDRWQSSAATGQFYLDFRSCYLQQQSLDLAAVSCFVDLVFSLFYESGEILNKICKVGRVDIAVDVGLPENLDWSDLDRFVYRAKKRDCYPFLPPLTDSLQELQDLLSDYDLAISALSSPLGNKGGQNANFSDRTDINLHIPAHLLPVLRLAVADYANNINSQLFRVISTKRPQTIYFGRFASECYARLYDKLASLELHQKEYMRDIWSANGWDGESPVWRVEFSLSGDFLKNFKTLFDDSTGEALDLRDFNNFCKVLPRLWRYLTFDWLRHCDPSNDSHSHRWEVSEFWGCVQSAFESEELPYFRQRFSLNPNTEPIKAQALGCLLTYAALSSEIFDSSPNLVFNEVRDFFYSPDFYPAYLERCSKLGVDAFSDTQITAQFRSERISLGGGS